MAISDRINSIATHIEDTYDTFDLSNTTIDFNKNIQNIPKGIRKSYLDIMNNGVEVVWNNWEKVIGEGTILTLNNTLEAKMKIDLKGNTYQDSTTGKNLVPTNDIVETEINGLKYSCSNGVLKVNGTASANTTITLATNLNIGIDTPSNYRISVNKKGTTASGTIQYILRNNSNSILGYVNTIVANTQASNSFQSSGTIDNIIFVVVSGTPITNAEFTFQVEAGTSVSNWEEYTGNQPSPNPDYPQDIQVVSGDNTIKVEGKNLCNGVNQNYFITPQALAGVYQNNSGLIIKVDGVSKYTISTKESQQRYRVGCTDTIPQTATANVQVYGYTDKGGTSDSITLDTTGHSYILINATDLGAIQVEKGETATTYTPYVSQSYPVNLGNIELCKIGDYQDSIVKDSGKWYLHKEIGKVVLNGSETWNNWTSNNRICFYTNIANGQGTDIVSNYFKKSTDTYFPDFNSIIYNGNSNKNMLFRMSDDTTISTTDQFKTWLSTHNTIVYYVLETPTNEQITDTTLINQLNALEGANSYDNQTNVSQDNNDLAGILNATALQEIS